MFMNKKISKKEKTITGLRFDEIYSIERKIGDGGFGTVFSGNRLEDNLKVAIKVIYKEKITYYEKCNNCIAPLEISLLKKVQEIPGVIKLIDWHERMDSYIIVMEAEDSLIDLFDFITKSKVLDEKLAQFIFRQLVQTIIDIHKKGIVHRDIKSENILINTNTFAVKIIDFGAAAYLKDGNYPDFNGTILFSPPEWISQKQFIAESATVWSLGIVLYDMVCGNIPFDAESLIISADISFNRDLSAECKDLIEKCLSLFPLERPLLEEILSHPWMKANLVYSHLV